MITLSPKALRFIEAGLNLIPDPSARSAWVEWACGRSITTLSKAPLPAHLLNAALTALECKVQDLRQQRAQACEDDIFNFDNDISFVTAIETTLLRAEGLVS